MWNVRVFSRGTPPVRFPGLGGAVADSVADRIRDPAAVESLVQVAGSAPYLDGLRPRPRLCRWSNELPANNMRRTERIPSYSPNMGVGRIVHGKPFAHENPARGTGPNPLFRLSSRYAACRSFSGSSSTPRPMSLGRPPTTGTWSGQWSAASYARRYGASETPGPRGSAAHASSTMLRDYRRLQL